MRSDRLAMLFVIPLAACTWETDLPDAAKNIHVDASRELLVTDDAIVSGRLAENRTNGPLSFRRAMSALAASDALTWLDAWSARLRDEGHADRAASFEATVTCRWLRAS